MEGRLYAPACISSFHFPVVRVADIIDREGKGNRFLIDHPPVWGGTESWMNIYYQKQKRINETKEK